ncbi:jhy protein homolog [Genypterus blacodes]|uniref:jhy protein homolog n=1 Tax=Genypterus blacodes TaxID=154954 RepID=UPI003F76A4A0
MDKHLKHGKTNQMLKNEHEEPHSPTQAAQVDLWDSVESDTESLAQERAYQQQLQRCISCPDQTHRRQSQEENSDSLEEGEGVDEDETAHLQVYDSLEVAARRPVKRNPSEYLDRQVNEMESRQVRSDDVYSELRFDPDWRTNVKGASRFDEPLQLSEKEYQRVCVENLSQLHGKKEEVAQKGGYSYVVITSPAAANPHVNGSETAKPYHLHPQDGQTNRPVSGTSHRHNRASKHKSSDPEHQSPSVSSGKDKGNNSTLQEAFKVNQESYREYAGASPSSSVELSERLEDLHAQYIQEIQTYQEEELDGEEGRAIEKQQKSSSTSKKSKPLAKKKTERLTEDIVERNKITLGRMASSGGSYLKVHGPKKEKPHHSKEVYETPEETTTADNTMEADPEMRWLQKIQQLKVTQLSREKKARQKGNPSRQKPGPPVLGVKAEQEDRLSPSAENTALVTQSNLQKTTSSQPSAPTIHLNIHLNTSPPVLPYTQQKGQDAFVNLTSPHGPPQVHYINSAFTRNATLPQPPAQNGTAVPQFAFSSMRQQKMQGKPIHGLDVEQNLWQLENNAGQWQSHAWSQHSGSHTVLPPISKPLTGTEAELSYKQIEQSVNVGRINSEGYLVQMMRQKELKEQVSYTAYTLKDYRQLKPSANLQGLGPDYTATEKTAENMRRQKLYSDQIRKENKKISRIRFLPAKSPEGNDKKILRMKALEYSKTIAKPTAPSKPKPQQTSQQSASLTEPAAYLEGLDLSQMAALEMLRKHQEKKQALALLRKVHGV